MMYPFKDDCAEILRGLLSDLNILVPNGMTGVYLRRLFSTGTRVCGEVWGSSPALMVGKFALDIATNGATSALSEGVGSGLVVAGKIEGRLSAGQNILIPINLSAIHPACIMSVAERSVRSITSRKLVAKGKVAFVEGDGVRIVKTSDSSIRIDAIGSTGAQESCCDDGSGSILGVNDATPDEQGNIGLNLQPYSEPSAPTDIIQILRINTSPGKITLSLAQ